MYFLLQLEKYSYTKYKKVAETIIGGVTMYHKHKFIKHHRFNCLSTKEKMCIAGIITVSFMRGICVGMYLSEK